MSSMKPDGLPRAICGASASSFCARTTIRERSPHDVHTAFHKKLCPLVDIADVRTILSGAQKCAAHRLHRLTHERPAPTTNRKCRSSVVVATGARSARARVTGSVRGRLTTTLLALGLDCTEAATSWRRWLPGHPAAAMGEAV